MQGVLVEYAAYEMSLFSGLCRSFHLVGLHTSKPDRAGHCQGPRPRGGRRLRGKRPRLRQGLHAGSTQADGGPPPERPPQFPALKIIGEGYFGYAFLFLQEEEPDRAAALYRRSAAYALRLLGGTRSGQAYRTCRGKNDEP